MNDVSFQPNRFRFDVEPVFRVYEEVAEIYTYPTPERVLDSYDHLVSSKIKDMDLSGITHQGGAVSTFMQLEDMELHVRRRVENALGMTANIQQHEIIRVLQHYHMMYFDDDWGKNFQSSFRNLPIRDVW